jgi:hypothetical protein
VRSAAPVGQKREGMKNSLEKNGFLFILGGEVKKKFGLLSLFQNSVSFDEALAVFRPTNLRFGAYKTAIFKGCSFKTEVLKEPLFYKNKSFSEHWSLKPAHNKMVLRNIGLVQYPVGYRTSPGKMWSVLRDL